MRLMPWCWARAEENRIEGGDQTAAKKKRSSGSRQFGRVESIAFSDAHESRARSIGALAQLRER